MKINWESNKPYSLDYVQIVRDNKIDRFIYANGFDDSLCTHHTLRVP